MSLDTEKLHRLKGKGFDRLYSESSQKWNEMVATATAYAKTFVEVGGEVVRPADISAVL